MTDKKIGIFGGTFDPIHSGHIKIAQRALLRFSLDKVYFMPCYVRPIKGKTAAGFHDRINMVKIAIQGKEHFELSDYEIKKRGKSYTINTLNYFRRKNRNSKLYLIIGSDLLSELMLWKEIEKFSGLCEIIVYPRDEKGYSIAPELRRAVFDLKMHFIKGPLIKTSSTALRNGFMSGHVSKSEIDKKVINYIEGRSIYEVEREKCKRNR